MIVGTPKLLDQLTPDPSSVQASSEKQSALEKKGILLSRMQSRNNSKRDSATGTTQNDPYSQTMTLLEHNTSKLQGNAKDQQSELSHICIDGQKI